MRPKVRDRFFWMVFVKSMAQTCLFCSMDFPQARTLPAALRNGNPSVFSHGAPILPLGGISPKRPQLIRPASSLVAMMISGKKQALHTSNKAVPPVSRGYGLISPKWGIPWRRNWKHSPGIIFRLLLTRHCIRILLMGVFGLMLTIRNPKIRRH